MPTSQDVKQDAKVAMPDNFQTGFVQAMLFTQGIVEPTGRDLADAISALQQYRLVSRNLRDNRSGAHSSSV